MYLNINRNDQNHLCYREVHANILLSHNSSYDYNLRVVAIMSVCTDRKQAKIDNKKHLLALELRSTTTESVLRLVRKERKRESFAAHEYTAGARRMRDHLDFSRKS